MPRDECPWVWGWLEVVGRNFQFWVQGPHWWCLVVVVGIVNVAGDGLAVLQDQISRHMGWVACVWDANAALYPPGWGLPRAYGLLVEYLPRYTQLHPQKTLATYSETAFNIDRPRGRT